MRSLQESTLYMMYIVYLLLVTQLPTFIGVHRWNSKWENNLQVEEQGGFALAEDARSNVSFENTIIKTVVVESKSEATQQQAYIDSFFIVVARMHLLDQENAPQWIDFGATNIQAAKQVGQSFQPSCYDLVRVDVDLTNWGSQGSATAKILRSGSTISTAFTTDLATDGTWSRFDFPSAVDVTPGERLVLQLESDSDPLPLWKYLEDDDTYPYGKRFISGDAKLGDFFFRTYSTSCSTASGRGLPSVPTEYPSDETGTAAPVYCTDDWIAMGYCVSAYKAAYPECKSGWCLESEYLIASRPNRYMRLAQSKDLHRT